MSNGWCAVAVDHEVALDPQVVEVDVGDPLRRDLVLANHTEDRQPASSV